MLTIHSIYLNRVWCNHHPLVISNEPYPGDNVKMILPLHSSCVGVLDMSTQRRMRCALCLEEVCVSQSTVSCQVCCGVFHIDCVDILESALNNLSNHSKEIWMCKMCCWSERSSGVCLEESDLDMVNWKLYFHRI